MDSQYTLIMVRICYNTCICHEYPACFLMKTSALMIAATALLSACAHSITHEQAERELKRSLTCTRNASIDDMKKWVSTLGGTISVQTRFQNGPVSEQNGWMIQLKDPIQIFGQDVSDISIMTASDDYGEYTEYSSLFSGQSIESAAQFPTSSRIMTMHTRSRYTPETCPYAPNQDEATLFAPTMSDRSASPSGTGQGRLTGISTRTV